MNLRNAIQCSVKMVALCATLESSAAYIYTESWGTSYSGIWDINGLYDYITSQYTPGSYDFDYQRLVRPAYYAWLDGYDTRAFATYDTYPTESPTAYRRLLYFDAETNTTFGTFLSRRDDMRNGRIAPFGPVIPLQVSWSSEIVDSLPDYYLEGPSYSDFNFTKKPLPLIYYTESSVVHDNTKFCFCFNQLLRSDYFPIGNTVRAKNPFQTMLSANAFGTECAHNDMQIYDQFIKTDVERSTIYHTTFDDLVRYEFYPRAYYESITNISKRILVPTLASADQALSLFSRSYKNEPPCTHLTKSVRGSAKTEYEAEGTITCNATFDYANNSSTISDASASFGSPTVKTNAIVKTDLPYQKTSPCAAYVNIMSCGANASAYVDLYGIAPGEAIYMSFDDLADVLETFFQAEGSSTITFDMYAYYDSYWKNVSVAIRKHGGSSPVYSSWRGHFTGTDTVSTAPIKASAIFSYLYETSTDPVHLVNRTPYPCEDRWVSLVTKESWYMFSSFCFTTNAPYFYMAGNLRDHMSSFSIEADDYGFKCLRKTAEGSSFHGDLMGYYRAEIQAICDKCYSYTGHTFHQDPKTYMGLTSGKISSLFNGDADFEARIDINTLDSDDVGGITLSRISPGHYVDDSGLVGAIAAYTTPSISCTFKDYPSIPREKHVETYMGIVTEIDWLFNQLILTN